MILCCPICGKKPKVNGNTIKCCVAISAKTLGQARRSWNTRKPQDQLWQYLLEYEDSGRCRGAITAARDIKDFISRSWGQ